MHRWFGSMLVVVMSAAIVAAQTPAPAAPAERPSQNSRPTTPPPAPSSPAQAPAPPSAPAPPTPPATTTTAYSSWSNVQIELTLSDSAQNVKKTVTMTVVDGRMGSIRSQLGNALLNVDATIMAPRGALMRGAIAGGRGGRGAAPTTTRDTAAGTVTVLTPAAAGQEGRLLLSLTVQYRPNTSGSSTLASIDESLSVAVEDGKAMLVSTSTDPTSDRRVSVEVKATVIK